MSKFTLGLSALALVAALAGCSGSDSDTGPSSTTSAKATTTSATPSSSGGVTTTSSAGGAETTTTAAPSGEVGDEASYTASLAKGLAAGGDGGELQVTDTEAACVAPTWIDAIGVDTLVTKGVAVDELADPNFSFPDLALSEAQAEPMVDAFNDCGVDIFEQYRKVLTTGLSAEQASCVDGEFSDDEVRTFLAQSLVASEASPAIQTKIAEVSENCELPGAPSGGG